MGKNPSNPCLTQPFVVLSLRFTPSSSFALLLRFSPPQCSSHKPSSLPSLSLSYQLSTLISKQPSTIHLPKSLKSTLVSKSHSTNRLTIKEESKKEMVRKKK
ncbi:hypothetical protein RND81_03G020500 [Saponaria officinalis]|uniref:Uncharacterized protein n=1 Tax=Saponaria officinalis TaxID=3572 RepID=A0AAW1M2Z3_SAPOF